MFRHKEAQRGAWVSHYTTRAGDRTKARQEGAVHLRCVCLCRERPSDQRINGPSDQVRYCSFCASLTGAPPSAGERQRNGIGSVGHRWSVGRMVGWSDDSSRQSPIKRKCQVAIESSSCQIEIRCHFIIQQEPGIAPQPRQCKTVMPYSGKFPSPVTTGKEFFFAVAIINRSAGSL